MHYRIAASAILITITLAFSVTAAAQTAGQAGTPANNGQAVAPGQSNPQNDRRVEAGRPFPPLPEAAQKRLDQLLKAWEASSNKTKTLSCKFTRWHFDNTQAPLGIHYSKASGEIRYAAPDKGLFRVDSVANFQGMEDGKPKFGNNPNSFGEYWVCNGSEILEFDRKTKTCNIQVLPPEMRGQKIFESPLPFVFNLDAEKINDRYWMREVQPPEGANVYVLEAYPKRQSDRAQYKSVVIVINAKDFLPQALIMYAPNFHPQTANIRDHYEFTDIAQNAMLANLKQFLDSFIRARPPADWTIVRENFGAMQQAAAPAGQPAQVR